MLTKENGRNPVPWECAARTQKGLMHYVSGRNQRQYQRLHC